MDLLDDPRVRHAAQLLAETRVVTAAAARPVIVAMLVRLDVHLLNTGDVVDLDGHDLRAFVAAAKTPRAS